MSYGVWSDENTEALKRMWQEGLSAAQIAKAIGGKHTRSSILGKIHRLGLGGRVTEERKARLAAEEKRRIDNQRQRERRQAIAAARPPKEPRPRRRNVEIIWQRRIEAEASRPIEIMCEPIGIRDELKGHHCRYEIGRCSAGLAIFCGAHVEAGRSWCPGHARVVFRSSRPVSAPAKQPAEIGDAMEKGLMLRKVDEFAHAGKTTEEIAELIGMSERAVRNTMAMYHIKVRKPSPACPMPAMHRLMGGK